MFYYLGKRLVVPLCKKAEKCRCTFTSDAGFQWSLSFGRCPAKNSHSLVKHAPWKTGLSCICTCTPQRCSDILKGVGGQVL